MRPWHWQFTFWANAIFRSYTLLLGFSKHDLWTVLLRPRGYEIATVFESQLELSQHFIQSRDPMTGHTPKAFVHSRW